MTTNRHLYKVSFGILMLTMVCLGTFSICGWLVAWCLQASSLKQIILAVVISLIGILALVLQIWTTRHYITRILCSSIIELPYTIQQRLIEQGIDDSKVVIVQTAQPLAFCFGFLNPKICLSTGLVDLLSTSQLQAVLLHEDYHRQRFDPLRILAVKSISSALFFLPFIHEWCHIFEIKLELDADHYAVQRTSRSALAGALHNLLQPSSKILSISPLGVITAGLSANSARIAALLGERSKPEQIPLKSLISSTAIIWTICVVLMI